MKNVTTKHTSLNLPETLLMQANTKIPQIFITGKQSYVPILNALFYAFTRNEKSCAEKLPRLLELQEIYRNNSKTVKIFPSLPPFLIDVVRGKYQNDGIKMNTTQIIELALIDMLTAQINLHTLLSELPLPYPFSGTKNLEMAHITENYLNEIWAGEDSRTYCEPFCGSGALFFALPLKENWQYYLNDLDANKINFLRAVKYRLAELCDKIYSNLESNKHYIKADAYLPKNWLHKFDNTKYPNHLDVEMASRFFIYCHEKRRKSHIRNNTAYRQLAFLPLYSVKLRKANASLTNMDALAFMDKMIPKKNGLFLIDSPYPLTESYFNDVDDKFYRKHYILSKRCHRITQSDTDVFLYYCRITPPASLYRKTPEKVPQISAKLNQKIDALYAGKGYYKFDYPMTDYITERLISNYCGSGAEQY